MQPDRYAKYQNIPEVKPLDQEEEEQEIVEPSPAPEILTEVSQSNPNDKYSKYQNIPEVKPEEPKEEVKSKEKKPTLGERFGKGLEESTSGQAVKLLKEKSKKPEEVKDDPSFWETLVQTSGTLTGDLPYMAAGATLGAAAGGALGSAVPGIGTAIGATAGGAIGGFAFNSFLKESLKEYHDFQDKGGDLTFGDFLNRADKVANKTLKEGALGLMLGAVQKSIPLLKNTPIGKLFTTKYIGKPLEKTTQIGAEVATATAVPAAMEGRLPTAQDVAVASVMFAAPHAAGQVPKLVGYLPNQIGNIINRQRFEPINLAVAEKMEQQNLPYPALNELKGDIAGLKKNNADLSTNLAEFDGAYMQQLADKIENISLEDFPSSRDAGLSMRRTLLGQTPDTKPITFEEMIPIEGQPIKPVKAKLTEPTEIPKPQRIDRPLARENNPIQQGLNEISDVGFVSDVAGGREIEGEFHKLYDQNKSVFDDRYQNMERSTYGMTGVDENLVSTTEAFIEQHSQSAVPNSPESKVINAAERVLNMLTERNEEGETIGPAEFSVSELIKTNQSLKKIPKWNLPGDFRRVLGQLIEDINMAIVGHIENENPNLANEFIDLNHDYRMFKNRFENSATNVLFDPTFKEQAIHGKFSNIDGFNQIAEALSTSPDGQQILNKLRRDVWQKKLGDGPLAARTENAFVDSLSRMNEREFSNLMEYLTPEQRVAVNRRILDVNRMRDSVNQYEAEYTQATENYNQALENQKRETKKQRRDIGEDHEKKMQEYKLEVQRLKKIQEGKRHGYENAKVNSKNKSLEDLRNEVTEKQDLLVSITEQNPAKIVDNMRTEEGIIRLKRMSQDIPGGPEMFKAASRFETENMFSFVKDSLIENKRVPYNQLKKNMSNKDFRAKLKAMNGEGFVKSMDELVSAADSLSDVYKTKQIEFITDPAAYESFINAATALGVAHGELSIPLLLQVGKKMGLRQIGSWWKRDNYNQKGIDKAIRAARALKNGNKKEISEAAKNLNNNPLPPKI